MKLFYRICNNNKYENVKAVLKAEFEISDRLLLKLRRNNKIFLNSEVCSDVKVDVNNQDLIEVLLDIEEDNSNIVPIKMDLNILYEDDGLLILNKPARITYSSINATL